MSSAAAKAVIVVVTAGVCAAILNWGADDPAPADPATRSGRRFDEATVRFLLPHLADAKNLHYDPVSIVRLTENLELELDWDQHPEGRILITTNAMGFREDAETQVEKSGPRVLVVGDSHTSGVVHNDESFANRLEARLGVEVINAGVGSTGPFEILGSLRKHLSLQPDLVIAVLYTGNDFANTLRFVDYFERRPFAKLPQEAEKVYADVRGAIAHDTQLVQGIRQAFRFHHQPERMETALEAAIGCYRDMAAECERAGAKFLVAVLPTKLDVDWSDDVGRLGLIVDGLGLSAEEVLVGAKLGRRFLAALAEDGIETIDLQPPLRAAAEQGGPLPMYWTKDHHLSLAGHAVVGAELVEPARRLLAAAR